MGAERVLDDHATRVTPRRRAQLSRPGADPLRATARRRPTPWSRPRSAEQVAAVLAACARAGVAVVPFGGGTSVVGGVEALRGASRGGRLARPRRGWTALLEVDPVSLTARVEPGIFGPGAGAAAGRARPDARALPAVVRVLHRRRLGGHALRRARRRPATGGSTSWSRRCAARRPSGPLATRDVPATAAGPSAARAGGGLGGRAGRDHRGHAARAPAARGRATTRAGRFAPSRRAPRPIAPLEQAGASPDVARLSDEEETRLSMALASSGSAGRAARAAPTCACAATRAAASPSPASRARRTRSRAGAAARRACCARRGAWRWASGPGGHGCKGRFAAPYLRDELLDRGVMVETLETATTWSNLHRLYAAVGAALREALAARGTPPARDVPRLAPLPVGRVAVLHLHRAPGAREPSSSSGARPRRPPATRSRPTAARSPTTTRSAPTTRRGWSEEMGELGLEVLRGREGAPRPGRDHEPREAAADGR